MLNELIDKIEVYQAEKIDGERYSGLKFIITVSELLKYLI